MTKIEILEKLLNKLQDEENYYNWKSVSKCNCGQLLQVLDYSDDEIKEIAQFDRDYLEKVVDEEDVDDIRYTISELERNYEEIDGVYFYLFNLYKEQDIQCSITKLPFTEVVNKLLGIGFTLDELIDLEHLSNPKFLPNDTRSYTKINNKQFYFYQDNKSDLIKYIQNWIQFEKNK